MDYLQYFRKQLVHELEARSGRKKNCKPTGIQEGVWPNEEKSGQEKNQEFFENVNNVFINEKIHHVFVLEYDKYILQKGLH